MYDGLSRWIRTTISTNTKSVMTEAKTFAVPAFSAGNRVPHTPQ